MVDFQLWECCEAINALAQDNRLFDAYPKLAEFYERVKALPKFAAFLESDKHLAAPFVPPNFAKIKF